MRVAPLVVAALLSWVIPAAAQHAAASAPTSQATQATGSVPNGSPDLTRRDARGAQSPERQAWRILEAGVADNSVQKRVEAVRALGYLTGNQEALRMARGALGDKRPAVRTAAVSTLGQMHSTDSTPELKQMLRDQDPSVVIAAASALLKLKDPTGYEVYYEILTGDRKCLEGLPTQAMETLHDHQKAATTGLEEGIGFIPFVTIGYSAVRVLRSIDPTPVRAAAARALAGDPDPRSGGALLQASRDESSIVRLAALGAIAERDNPALLTGVVPALSDHNAAVRDVAAAAVIRLSAIARPVAGASASAGAVSQSASRRGWIKELSGHLGAWTASLAQ